MPSQRTPGYVVRYVQLRNTYENRYSRNQAYVNAAGRLHNADVKVEIIKGYPAVTIPVMSQKLQERQ
jgi:hypothetical protein